MPTPINSANIKFTCAYGSSINLPQQINNANRGNVPEHRLGAKNPTTEGKKMVFGKAYADIAVDSTSPNSPNCKAKNAATATYVFEQSNDSPTVKAQYSMKAGQYGWFEIISTL